MEFTVKCPRCWRRSDPRSMVKVPATVGALAETLTKGHYGLPEVPTIVVHPQCVMENEPYWSNCD